MQTRLQQKLQERLEVNSLPEDFPETLCYAVYNLESGKDTRRNADIFWAHYMLKKSYAQLGEEYNLTRSRIQSICENIIDMLCENYGKLLKHGISGYIRNIREKAEKERVAAENAAYIQVLDDFLEDFTEMAEKRRNTVRAKITAEMEADGCPSASTPIENTGFTYRTINSLKRAGYNTVGDLIRSGQQELLDVRGFGKKGYQEVAKALVEKYGESKEEWWFGERGEKLV